MHCGRSHLAVLETPDLCFLSKVTVQSSLIAPQIITVSVPHSHFSQAPLSSEKSVIASISLLHCFNLQVALLTRWMLSWGTKELSMGSNGNGRNRVLPLTSHNKKRVSRGWGEVWDQTETDLWSSSCKWRTQSCSFLFGECYQAGVTWQLCSHNSQFGFLYTLQSCALFCYFAFRWWKLHAPALHSIKPCIY